MVSFVYILGVWIIGSSLLLTCYHQGFVVLGMNQWSFHIMGDNLFCVWILMNKKFCLSSCIISFKELSCHKIPKYVFFLKYSYFSISVSIDNFPGYYVGSMFGILTLLRIFTNFHNVHYIFYIYFWMYIVFNLSSVPEIYFFAWSCLLMLFCSMFLKLLGLYMYMCACVVLFFLKTFD